MAQRSMGYDQVSSITPTRTFMLVVDESLNPFTKEPKVSDRYHRYTSIQLKDGRWFNTTARKDATQAIYFSYARLIDKTIKEMVQAEARKLQNYWHAKVPQYFNRRSYGMFFSKKGYGRRTYKYKRQSRSVRSVKGVYTGKFKNGPFITGPHDDFLYRTRGSPIPKKYTNRQQFAGRHRTGQLRRALEVKNLSVSGCTLHVKPCYASTGRRVDYVKILMYGASGRYGHPYVPEFDRRIKARNGYWRGISDMYWKRWQLDFQKKVREANVRLHNRISEYLVKMKVLEKRDINRVYRRSKAQKDINIEQKKKRTRKGISGRQVVPNSPYNKGRVGKSYGGRNKYIKRTPWNYNSNPFTHF